MNSIEVLNKIPFEDICINYKVDDDIDSLFETCEAESMISFKEIEDNFIYERLTTRLYEEVRQDLYTELNNSDDISISKYTLNRILYNLTQVYNESIGDRRKHLAQLIQNGIVKTISGGYKRTFDHSIENISYSVKQFAESDKLNNGAYYIMSHNTAKVLYELFSDKPIICSSYLKDGIVTVSKTCKLGTILVAKTPNRKESESNPDFNSVYSIAHDNIVDFKSSFEEYPLNIVTQMSQQYFPIIDPDSNMSIINISDWEDANLNKFRDGLCEMLSTLHTEE